MILARPDYAWLLLALPLAGLALWLEARRRRGFRQATGLPAPRHGWRHGLCFLGGLGLLALAAAGPGWGNAPELRGPAAGRLMIALDCSKSMLAQDLRPDRLTAAKTLVRAVLARLPGMPVGLVTFAGQARLACPITSDRAGLLGFLEAASPESMPVGGTNLAGALEVCRLGLAGDRAGAVLLVSDGEQTRPFLAPSPMDIPPLLTVAVGGVLPVGLPDGAGGWRRDRAGQPIRAGVDVATLQGLSRPGAQGSFRLGAYTGNPAPAIASALKHLLPGQTAPSSPHRSSDYTALCLGSGLMLLVLDGWLCAGPRLALVLLPGLLLSLPAIARAESAAALVGQGLAAYRQGRFEQAREAFLNARVRAPDAPEILYDLGTTYYRLGRFDRAATAFAQAAERATGRLRARALFNQGNAACQLGHYAEAAMLYAAVLAIAPDDADAKANLALAKHHGQTAPSQPTPPPETGAPSPTPRPQQAGQAPTSPNERPKKRPAAETGQAPDTAPEHGVLDRVPDRPGLPLASPIYAKPAVEQDW